MSAIQRLVAAQRNETPDSLRFEVVNTGQLAGKADMGNISTFLMLAATPDQVTTKDVTSYTKIYGVIFEGVAQVEVIGAGSGEVETLQYQLDSKGNVEQLQSGSATSTIQSFDSSSTSTTSNGGSSADQTITVAPEQGRSAPIPRSIRNSVPAQTSATTCLTVTSSPALGLGYTYYIYAETHILCNHPVFVDSYLDLLIQTVLVEQSHLADFSFEGDFGDVFLNDVADICIPTYPNSFYYYATENDTITPVLPPNTPQSKTIIAGPSQQVCWASPY